MTIFTTKIHPVFLYIGRDTDADFNVGVALGGVQAAAHGVWVAMNGILLPWDRVERDDTGQFVPRRRQLPVTV